MPSRNQTRVGAQGSRAQQPRSRRAQTRMSVLQSAAYEPPRSPPLSVVKLSQACYFLSILFVVAFIHTFVKKWWQKVAKM